MQTKLDLQKGFFPAEPHKQDKQGQYLTNKTESSRETDKT